MNDKRDLIEGPGLSLVQAYTHIFGMQTSGSGQVFYNMYCD